MLFCIYCDSSAEHLRLPGVVDIYEDVIASKMVAHAADAVKGIAGTWGIDNEVVGRRNNLDWKGTWRDVP